MLRDERGIALLTVIIMTAVMMVIVSLVGYKVLRSIRGSATDGLKTKTYYAASAGLDSARLQLSEDYINSNFWQYILEPDTKPGYSGPATTPAADLYLQNTDLEPGTIGSINNITVFVKDNNDGDDNYGIDTDQLVMVNIEATSADGRTTTMVEARLLYDDSTGGYSQLGGSAGREHFRDVSGVGDTSTLGSSTTTIGL